MKFLHLFFFLFYILFSSLKIGYGQFRFQSESEWKEAYEMIYQANLGNCDLAMTTFDSLRLNTEFKHAPSYLAIAKCLQKNGKEDEMNALIAEAQSSGILKKTIPHNSASHPQLKEKCILMLLEDQGSWSLKNEFIIDPELKENLLRSGLDFKEITPKIRRLPGRELHKLHIAELESIINEHGFPTVEMIGTQGMKGIKLVILHASIETLNKYENEYKDRFGSYAYAYLIDKKRVANKEKQLYGTQGDFDENKNLTFYPIEDEHLVNQRRMESGMEPLEIYARTLGIKGYKVPAPKE